MRAAAGWGGACALSPLGCGATGGLRAWPGCGLGFALLGGVSVERFANLAARRTNRAAGAAGTARGRTALRLTLARCFSVARGRERLRALRALPFSSRGRSVGGLLEPDDSRVHARLARSADLEHGPWGDRVEIGGESDADSDERDECMAWPLARARARRPAARPSEPAACTNSCDCARDAADGTAHAGRHRARPPPALPPLPPPLPPPPRPILRPHFVELIASRRRSRSILSWPLLVWPVRTAGNPFPRLPATAATATSTHCSVLPET